MFDKFKEAKVIQVPTAQGGPFGYVFNIKQGRLDHGEFPANKYQDADLEAQRINSEGYVRNPRRAAAAYALAGAGVVVAAVATTFAAMEHGNTEQGGPDSQAPVSIETRFVPSPTTEFTTVTQSPEVKIKRVRVTVTPRPHHPQHTHHVETNVHATPEAPVSSYDPPQDTYTPPPAPAAKPHPTPHLTIHHLHEH